jgi:hypothetical protein
MKKLRVFAAFYFTIITIAMKSQTMTASSTGLTSFLTSTLYVPVTGNASFDQALQKAFSTYWKITPYKLSQPKEFHEMEKINSKQSQKRRKEKKLGQPANFLFTWESTRFVITDICYANVFFYGDESMTESQWIDESDFFSKSKKMTEIQYRLDYIIKALNDMLTYTKDIKIGDPNEQQPNFLDTPGSPKTKKQSAELNEKLSDLFNLNAKNIKTKTLLFNKDMKYANKKVYSEEEIAKNYPYPYKFVSDKEFKEVLKSDNSEFVCFIPVYDQEETKMTVSEFVYEPSTRSTIYMNINYKFNKIEKEDMDQLKKVIFRYLNK